MLSRFGSDAWSVRRVRSGRPEAFEVLVFRYQRKAFAIARAAGVSSSSLDDVVQEAFFQAFRDLGALTVPSRFGAWFLQIVRNTAWRSLRKPAPMLCGSLPEVPAPPTESLEAKDFGEHIRAKVQSLPNGIREAVLIYYYEGGSVIEIARALEISRASAKKRLQRGRDLLRDQLWHELAETLRDMLPSARQWQLKGRHLSLIAIAAVPLLLKAAAARTAPVSDTALVPLTRVGNVIAIGAVVTALLVVTLSATATLWVQPRTTAREMSAPPVAETRFPVAKASVGGRRVSEHSDEAVAVDAAAPRTPSAEDPKHELPNVHKEVDMNRRSTIVTARPVTPVVAALTGALLSGALGAAEAGDLDGDGRLSIGDVHMAWQGTPPADGSFDAFSSHPCHGEFGTEWFSTMMVPMMIYLESISRNVEGSLPSWMGIWKDQVKVPPRETDPRVSVEIAPAFATGGNWDGKQLFFLLRSEVPLKAFSLIFESDAGVLQIPSPLMDTGWDYSEWFSMRAITERNRVEGPVRVSLSTPLYLASGGKYVVTFLGNTRTPVTSTEEMGLLCPARVARGTLPGTYRVRLAAGSEVVFEDGTVVAPEPFGDGVIHVEQSVDTGWDDAATVLRVDPKNRNVLGSVEFRLADREGRIGQEGAPLVVAAPGEDIVLRVQMRTETPLNFLGFSVSWPSDTLECGGRDGLTNGDGTLFRNPETGELYQRYLGNGPGCASLSPWPPRLMEEFHLAGYHVDTLTTVDRDRLLDHFKPLGEWIDVREFRLHVPEWLMGQDIPLQLGSIGSPQAAEFAPYGKTYTCGDGWSDDIRFQSAVVRIAAGEPPPPPPEPDYGIEVHVGEAFVDAGDVVEVPVYARADSPLALLRIALQIDPRLVAVEEVLVDIQSQKTGEVIRKTIPRGEDVLCQECDPNVPDCIAGIPYLAAFRDSGPEAVVVDVIPGKGVMVSYPGNELFEVLRLHVRAREGTAGSSASINPATVRYRLDGVAVEGSPGGTTLGILPFGPARTVSAGRVAILGIDLRRGDVNLDGAVDLSDAVATLSHLFLGTGDLPCIDGADADDNGDVEITDGIAVLSTLFLGQNAIRAPFPSCGPDPTGDEIGCAESRCP